MRSLSGTLFRLAFTEVSMYVPLYGSLCYRTMDVRIHGHRALCPNNHIIQAPALL